MLYFTNEPVLRGYVTNMSVHKYLFFLISTSILLSACAPQEKSDLQKKINQNQKDLNFERPAEPTFKIPELREGESPFQMPSNLIKTKDNSTVIIGSSTISNTKVQYSSRDSIVIMSGSASVLDDKKNILVKKNFSLSGKKNADQFFILLNDSNDNQNPDFLIRAKANCMGIDQNFSTDCSHIVIDVYMSHKGRFYTEQVETRYKSEQSKPNAELKPTEIENIESQQPDISKNIPPSNELITPAPNINDLQTEPTTVNEDQKILQVEGSDNSAEGRYQGTVGMVNLKELFAGSALPLSPEIPKPIESSKPQDPAATKSTPEAVIPDLGEILSIDLIQTTDGNIRSYNQAFGFPDNGSLRNATSLLTKQQSLGDKAYFEVVSPERKKHFATFELAQLITRLGEFKNEKWDKKIFVSNSSLLKGGPIKPHASHQIGNDVDLAYPTDKAGIKFPLVVSMNPRRYYTHNFSVEQTYKTFKYLFSQKDIVVERIFVDQAIRNEMCEYAKQIKEFESEDAELVRHMFRNLQHVYGHGDHYHLRIKCSSFDPGCRTRIYRQLPKCS
jgi:murein endopeptidase